MSDFKFNITVEDINAFNPCYPAETKLGEGWSGNLIDVLKLTNTRPSDKLWAVTWFLGERLNRLFAVHCARQALMLIENPDPRSVKACDVAERFANGQATKEELQAASDDAWAAARDASDSALAAASDDAWAAARAAARDASDAARASAWAAMDASDSALAAASDYALAAARAAARDARDAAMDAARDAQIDLLIQLIQDVNDTPMTHPMPKKLNDLLKSGLYDRSIYFNEGVIDCYQTLAPEIEKLVEALQSTANGWNCSACSCACHDHAGKALKSWRTFIGKVGE